MEQKKHLKLPSVDIKEFHYKPKADILCNRLLTPQIPTHVDFSEYCTNNRRGSLNQKLPSLEKSSFGFGSNSPPTPFTTVNIARIDLSSRFRVRQPVIPDTKNHETRVKTSISALHREDEPKETITTDTVNTENIAESGGNQPQEKPQTASRNFQRFKYNRHQKGCELKATLSEYTLCQTNSEDTGILDI
ncbi:unnamed protein product [Blepharisma stoltei]|uniref:Uncharacterized protein n=1 Tax=Blepharisma stoltei TaxID=1481888 RepID=A0AAU9JCT6_9CILI|nr:unnamed protein product [Blepharisma stoltei]